MVYSSVSPKELKTRVQRAFCSKSSHPQSTCMGRQAHEWDGLPKSHSKLTPETSSA